MHSEDLHTEELERAKEGKSVLSFGIDYLDDALNGLRPRDLVVVGGATGVGKSELAIAIAKRAAANCKNVLLIALEAERFEVTRRIKYQYVAEAFHADPPGNYIRLNFTDWLHHRYGDALKAYESYAADKFVSELSTLTLLCPDTGKFSKEQLELTYNELAPDHDLIVLDHLHYLAADHRESEYEHVRNTMWRLKEAINRRDVPVIAMSHLRKEDRRNDTFVPTLEDLHGSSEISKSATHVVTLAPCYELPDKFNPTNKFAAAPGSTLCRIIKSRTGHHGCTRYAALLKFDLNTNTYASGYCPYRVDKFATELTPMKYEDLEPWMGLGREPKA